MTTLLTVTGLVLVLAVLVLLFGFTLHQMMTCPLTMLLHLCCGTLSGLSNLIVDVVGAIGEAAGSAVGD